MDTAWENIELFTLCFARVAAFVTLLPVIGSRTIPKQVKVGIAVLLTIFMMSIVQMPVNTRVTETLPFFLLIIKEVLVGLTLGFLTKFIFVGIQIAGEIIGVQMGFGVAKVMDPGYQSQLSLIAEFQTMIAMLIYLTISGHHFLLRGIAYSYSTIPIGTQLHTTGIAGEITNIASGMFVSAVKIGAPVIAALLLSNVALGILARTVPQMNIFIVGLPLRIGVGFIALLVTMTLFVHIFSRLWVDFEHSFFAVIKLF
ncbi:flagellar type III secretion system protein FliR [candidate division KSB1 bacterium]|nr:MAG: flagellar type III secretion system protein FliR [candidate division KSB1 bacterium]